jgi:hypothetical protein
MAHSGWMLTVKTFGWLVAYLVYAHAVVTTVEYTAHLFSTARAACLAAPDANKLSVNSEVLCAEFWLNRYQQLIAGVMALVAAAIAAFLVWRQLWVMDVGRMLSLQQSASSRLGDLNKSFRLVAGLRWVANSMDAEAERFRRRATDEAYPLNYLTAVSGGLDNLRRYMSEAESGGDHLLGGTAASAALQEWTALGYGSRFGEIRNFYSTTRIGPRLRNDDEQLFLQLQQFWACASERLRALAHGLEQVLEREQRRVREFLMVAERRLLP